MHLYRHVKRESFRIRRKKKRGKNNVRPRVARVTTLRLRAYRFLPLRHPRPPLLTQPRFFFFSSFILLILFLFLHYALYFTFPFSFLFFSFFFLSNCRYFFPRKVALRTRSERIRDESARDATETWVNGCVWEVCSSGLGVIDLLFKCSIAFDMGTMKIGHWILPNPSPTPPCSDLWRSPLVICPPSLIRQSHPEIAWIRSHAHIHTHTDTFTFHSHTTCTRRERPIISLFVYIFFFYFFM